MAYDIITGKVADTTTGQIYKTKAGKFIRADGDGWFTGPFDTVEQAREHCETQQESNTDG